MFSGGNSPRIVIRPASTQGIRRRSLRTPVGWTCAAPGADSGHRPLGIPAAATGAQRSRAVSTQLNVFETGVVAGLPGLLVVLMAILAMLGIVANVASA
jgi:hypothetical protein